MRLRPALTRLLCLLLLLQWGTAFGHCMRLAPTHLLHVPLCTADGSRTIAVDADGREVPPPAPAAGAICPVCGALGGAALPEPPVALAPPLAIALVLAPQPARRAEPAPARRSTPPPRGPPLS